MLQILYFNTVLVYKFDIIIEAILPVAVTVRYSIQTRNDRR